MLRANDTGEGRSGLCAYGVSAVNVNVVFLVEMKMEAVSCSETLLPTLSALCFINTNLNR